MPAGKTRDHDFILIVEDDSAAADIFAQILRDNGQTAHVAADAESAWSYLEQSIPALILLDLRLPTLDGHQLLRRIRGDARLQRVPVAVITGDYFLEESAASSMEALGARIHFKPIFEHDLLRIVRAELPAH
jgi:CheY-like chemotaxis protein